MKVTADTNVLARAFLEDHPEQSKVAQAALSKAEIVALTVATLCELVWVLRSYKIQQTDIAGTIRNLINGANIVVNRPAAEAGESQLLGPLGPPGRKLFLPGKTALYFFLPARTGWARNYALGKRWSEQAGLRFDALPDRAACDVKVDATLEVHGTGEESSGGNNNTPAAGRAARVNGATDRVGAVDVAA